MRWPRLTGPPRPPLTFFVDDYVAIAVYSGGGRDRFGEPLPESRVEIPECLIAPRSTTEPQERSDLDGSRGVIYVQSEHTFHGSDRVEVLTGSHRGLWEVDGVPTLWPDGWEIPIRRGDRR
ncbi:hypothetical protein FDF08_09765 [Micrococcus luteus]|nr:hypothetical protein FDF08_09765 [Micrococcus luteus]